jgi:hypothetical protein
MKRLLVVAGLLACFGLQSSLEAQRHGAKRYRYKESKADMLAMQKVFVGWVDLRSNDWASHRYRSEESWAAVIDELNSSFGAAASAKWLPGRTVTVAKNKADVDLAGQDLYIKFSDVLIDYDYYFLYVSIHFIDPVTNREIAAIPARPYYGNTRGFESFLRMSLEEVGRKLQAEVTGTAISK